MPDSRRHRGPHPRDAELFAAGQIGNLQTAVEHLSWLLSRGYAPPSSLKLVGDRFELLERQRTAVMRSACSDESLLHRRQRQSNIDAVDGVMLAIDGFNLLTTVEAALSGGVLLKGRDGCVRDLASMHGSYRRVEETAVALAIIGNRCVQLGVPRCCWWLDQPVSNSGRLATMMREVAEENAWDWKIELVPDPDQELRVSTDIVVTADAGILDQCGRWFNLSAMVVENIPNGWLLDFSDGSVSG